jgi:hypothetical protein
MKQEKVPLDFQRNTVIPIPKKAGAKRCEEHRTISLTTHTSKILTRIINTGIEQKVDYCLAEDQFGFRRSKGKREATLALRIILEKRINRNKKTYVAFVDLEKTFDNVDWNRMFDILKKIAVKYKGRRIIQEPDGSCKMWWN